MIDTEAVCSIDGCSRPRCAKGYCYRHYARLWRWGDPLIVKKGGRIRRHYTERLDGKYVVIENACWEWTAVRNNKGYGMIGKGGKYGGQILATHAMFEHIHGRPPVGIILHTCDNPGCVNPEHLREATQSDNMRDCVAKGRHFSPFTRRSQ